MDTWFEVGPFAETETVEVVIVPGDDNAAEIAEVEADLRSLSFDDPNFMERQAVMLARRAELLAMPTSASRVTEVPTGETVAGTWRALATESKRALLVGTGVKVKVRPVVPGEVTAGGVGGRHVAWVEGNPSRISAGLRNLG